MIKIAVFSDDPEKYRDPRFVVSGEQELRMLAPIGHATTEAPVLLQGSDDEPPNTNGGKYGVTAGTAFMVSPCIALTNYHVVFGQALERPGSSPQEFKVKVSIGGQSATGVPFLWGDFANGRENDWAVIRLTPCIGKTTGWLPITFTKQQLPREVSIFGFYSDQNYSVLAGHDCVLIQKSSSATFWKTNCAMVQGTSGSPIGIFKEGSFQPTAMAFAMVRHKTDKLSYDPQDANFAIDLFHLFLSAPGLSKSILDDVAAYGASNPAQLPESYRPRTLLRDRMPLKSPSAELSKDSAPAAMPPEPRDIALPPTPQDIALPPTPRPIALPKEPAFLQK